MNAGSDKLDLSYPCPWEYTLIGHSQEQMRRAVDEILPDAEYSLALSHHSRTGKYCSLRLELIVQDETSRLEIHASLRAHRDILMVL